MVIDDTTYQLPIDNYIPIESNKSQIIIGHSFNHNMRHFNGWLKRYNGQYKKTAAFTISEAGLIYQHFNPRFYSNYFKDTNINIKSVIILLENDGWLIKDSENNQFITWIGDIYNESSKVVEKRWRGYNFWAPYSEQQFESMIELVKSLCDELNIPLTAIGHNTKVDKLINYKGVIYKSNIEKYHTDINPSWDCELFKTKIENYGK